MQPAERQKVFIEPDLSLDRIKKNINRFIVQTDF